MSKNKMGQACVKNTQILKGKLKGRYFNGILIRGESKAKGRIHD